MIVSVPFYGIADQINLMWERDQKVKEDYDLKYEYGEIHEKQV